MSKQVAECLLKIHIYDTRQGWQEKGIGRLKRFDFELTSEFRDWAEYTMGNGIACDRWQWDHFVEENEVVLVFTKRIDAIRFILSWT